MYTFHFPFTFRDFTYTATCDVIDQNPETLYHIIADDETLRQLFGDSQKIVLDKDGSYNRTIPRVVGGRDFIDALFEGFRAFQIANTQHS